MEAMERKDPKKINQPARWAFFLVAPLFAETLGKGYSCGNEPVETDRGLTYNPLHNLSTDLQGVIMA